MQWEPISTFDYEAEYGRQRSMFVEAWVSDGESVDYAQHWGHDGDEDDGWHDCKDVGYDGPQLISYTPTHWMRKPDPPGT